MEVKIIRPDLEKTEREKRMRYITQQMLAIAQRVENKKKVKSKKSA